MSRKLKKYNLKYEYLKLELEDTETTFWEYVSDFEHYFDKYYQRPKKGSPTAKENHVWVNEETGEVRHEPPNLTVEEMIEENKRAQREKESKKQERLVELKNRPDKIKKLYKKVAIATHPDKGGSEDEFKKVSDAFNNLDLATLLNLAGKYEVEYEVEDDDESSDDDGDDDSSDEGEDGDGKDNINRGGASSSDSEVSYNKHMLFALVVAYV